MCGIVGAVQIEQKGLDAKILDTVFPQMLVADSVRGVHGTGVFYVGANGEADTLKIGDHPFSLLHDKTWKPFIEKAKQLDARVLIGHNRLATVGGRTTKNAHPFVYKNIVMIHNGTLFSSSKLPLEKYECDSEALCYGIAKYGIDEVIRERVFGAYTIIYYDNNDQTLNIIRNGDRPLYVCKNEVWNRLMFASEEEMLRWVLKRNNLVADKIESVPINRLITIPIDGVPKNQNDIQLHIKGRDLRPKSYSSHSTSLSGGNGAIMGGSYVHPNTYPAVHTHTSTGIVPFKTKTQRKAEKLREKEERKKSPKITENARGKWMQANSLFGIKTQDNICFRISNIVEVDEAMERYRIIGAPTKMTPDQTKVLSFCFYVSGKKKMESLQESGYVRAKVQSIMLDITSGKTALNYEHMVWVSHCEPVFDSLSSVTNLV